MVSVYKDLVAIYILTAALLIVGAGVALYYLDGYIWMAVVIIIVTIILFAVLKTLNKKALKRFSGEVFTLYNECHIKQYMDKLDSLMANKNSKEQWEFQQTGRMSARISPWGMTPKRSIADAQVTDRRDEGS